MQPINQTAASLAETIQRGGAVGITANGMWYPKSVIVRIVNLFRKVFLKYDESLENAQNLASYLSSPKKVPSGAIKALGQHDSYSFQDTERLVAAVKKSIRNSVEKEEEQIHTLSLKRERLEATNDATKQSSIVELNRKIFSPERWPHRHTAACLDRGLLTQKYLGMDLATIERTSALCNDVDWLAKELLEWQGHQFPMVQYLRGQNDEQVRAKIEYTCRYRDFIALARQNRGLLDLCFHSVFKSMPDNFTKAIDLFIQAPKVQDELRRTFLDKRIRELANNGIRFEQLAAADPAKTPLKDVKLLIDGELQSISDSSNVVRIAKNVTTTVSSIFDEFEAQNSRFASLEYLQDTGVTQFDGRQPDLSKDEWWKSLPVIRRMTREQVESSFETSFKDGYALFMIRGSRASPTLNPEGTHGWSNIIYPLGDGTFNVLAVGKYSDHFPVGPWQTFQHIFRTFRACVTVADQNEYMNSRDRLSIPLPPLSKEKFLEIMSDLKNELLRSQRRELVFQAQGDNCASWVRTFVHRHFPDLKIEPYRTRFEDLDLPAPIWPVTGVKPLFPTVEGWQKFRRAFCSCFGAREGCETSDGHGGTRIVRLVDHQGWHDGYLQLPARIWQERNAVLAQIHQASSPDSAVA